MKSTRGLISAGLIAALPFIIPVQAAEDPHHPAGAAAALSAPQASPAPAAPQTSPAQPGMGMGGQGMMGMMGGQGMMGGMSMMNMMGMMRMMGGGDDAPGIGMIDRVEGRIAFLRTELRITDAQANGWNTFAAALRTNAQSLGAARTAMMAQMGAQPPSMAPRLEAQERWLAARLEGTRALRTAYTSLYAVLSDEQKRMADELLAPHMGMMSMGQMDQRGPMGPRPQ